MIAEELVGELIAKKLKISTAESCTGGMIASKIIDVAGVSSVYEEGFITYANEAKVKYLGVSQDTIHTYGVVSGEVVEEMALGCAKRTGAHLTIVTSGVAGPGGGTEKTPVGLVWMACFWNGAIYKKKEIFPGDRSKIREAACDAALHFALDILRKG